MLPASELANIRPLFITPCHSGSVTCSYANSVIQLTAEMVRRNMNSGFDIAFGGSLVTRARNEALVRFFVETSFTHVFWIDSDVGFQAESVFRLLLADRDVVAGAYPLKGFHPITLETAARLAPQDRNAAHLRFPVNGGLPDGTMIPLVVDEEGFLEVTEAPTGFMAIKRGVLDRMRQSYPELRYTPDGPPDPDRARHCFRFFDSMIEPETNRFLSEDYAFCRRWRDIGGKVHVDVTAKLSHVSNSFVFQGDFATTLKVAPYNAVGGPAAETRGA